jgi:hypothetical protein
MRKSSCLSNHYIMKTYRGVVVQIHDFLTTALIEDEWSVSRFGHYIPVAHYIYCWVGTVSGVDAEKSKFFTLL